MSRLRASGLLLFCSTDTEDISPARSGQAIPNPPTGINPRIRDSLQINCGVFPSQRDTSNGPTVAHPTPGTESRGRRSPWTRFIPPRRAFILAYLGFTETGLLFHTSGCTARYTRCRRRTHIKTTDHWPETAKVIGIWFYCSSSNIDGRFLNRRGRESLRLTLKINWTRHENKGVLSIL